MQELLKKLLGLLIQMQLKPQSGYGETTLIWKDGKIISSNVVSKEIYNA